MRLAAKVDRNHAEIMDELRKRGVFVRSTAALGKGFPDILAAFRGVFVQLEVKAPGEKPNAAQLEYLAECPGPVYVVSSADEAFRVVVEAVRPRKGEEAGR